MAKDNLGPIKYTQPQPYREDTRAVERGLEGVSSFGQQLITNDILGDFTDDAEEAIEAVATQVGDADVQAAQFQEEALNAAEGNNLYTETRLLKRAIENAPTTGARVKAELQLQKVLQDHAKYSPRMRDELIKEARAFANTSSELSELGIRDTTLSQSGGRMSMIEDRVTELKSIAYKSVDSGGMGMTSAFGTEAFAREFNARNKMLQNANLSELRLAEIKSREGVTAQTRETEWNKAVYGGGSQLNMFYTSLTDPTSALTQLAIKRKEYRDRGKSDQEILELEAQFSEEAIKIQTRIEGAVKVFRDAFTDQWGDLAGTPQYTAARQRMEDEIEGLRQVSSLVGDNSEEAWDVLKTVQTRRVAKALDEQPLTRALATQRQALGQDFLGFIATNDKLYQGHKVQSAIVKGLIETFQGYVPNGAHTGVMGSNTNPFTETPEEQIAKHQQSLNNDPAPLGGRTETAIDKLQMVSAQSEVIFKKVGAKNEPLQADAATNAIVVPLTKVMLGANLYKNESPDDQDLINEIREGTASDKFVEAIKLAEPNAVRALGIAWSSYSGNEASSYDSYSNYHDDIAYRFTGKEYLGNPLSEYVEIDNLSSIEKNKGRVSFTLNVSALRQDFKSENVNPKFANLAGYASDAKRQEEAFIKEVEQEIYALQEAVNVYTRGNAIRVWVARGAQGNPDWGRAFTGTLGSQERSTMSALGIPLANAEPQ